MDRYRSWAISVLGAGLYHEATIRNFEWGTPYAVFIYQREESQMTTQDWSLGGDTVSSSIRRQYLSTGDVESFEAWIDLDFDALIQWLLAKAAALSKKVRSRRKRHGDSKRWNRNGAVDIEQPMMYIDPAWYFDIQMEVCTVSVVYAEARHMKRDTQLPCCLHILNFPHVHTSISTRYRVYVVSEYLTVYFWSVRIFPRSLRQGRSTYVSS